MRDAERADADFDEPLDSPRKETDSLRRSATVGPEFGNAVRYPVKGVGEAVDGQIRATASPDRLDSIEFTAQITHLPAHGLSAGIVTAANAALDRARSALGPVAQTA